MKLHYYRVANFGDALSPVLVNRLSGEKVRYAHPRSADLMATGSVLFSGASLFLDRNRMVSAYGIGKLALKIYDAFQPVLHIWGSGLLLDAGVTSAIPVRRARFNAVRGKRTLHALLRAGMIDAADDVVLGDPGLLYPMLLDSAHPVVAGKWDVGVVPHYLDAQAGKDLAEGLAAKGRSVKLVDVNNPDPLQTVADIGSCREVLSSSLHGLIVADAFGIPNEHVTLSNLGQTADEVQFKFEDYYTAWREDVPRGMSVMPREVYSSLKDALLNSFPFRMKE